jgi:acyl-coenzyme A synthetase/AMP-(fatty) acid ligase
MGLVGAGQGSGEVGAQAATEHHVLSGGLDVAQRAQQRAGAVGGCAAAAYVVLKQGHDTSAADIRRFVADNVASYKQVRKLSFVDAIPKSPSGKILRRVLRDQAAQESRPPAHN